MVYERYIIGGLYGRENRAVFLIDWGNREVHLTNDTTKELIHGIAFLMRLCARDWKQEDGFLYFFDKEGFKAFVKFFKRCLPRRG